MVSPCATIVYAGGLRPTPHIILYAVGICAYRHMILCPNFYLSDCNLRGKKFFGHIAVKEYPHFMNASYLYLPFSLFICTVCSIEINQSGNSNSHFHLIPPATPRSHVSSRAIGSMFPAATVRTGRSLAYPR